MTIQRVSEQEAGAILQRIAQDYPRIPELYAEADCKCCAWAECGVVYGEQGYLAADKWERYTFLLGKD